MGGQNGNELNKAHYIKDEQKQNTVESAQETHRKLKHGKQVLENAFCSRELTVCVILLVQKNIV